MNLQDENIAPPLFVFGAFEDNTYIWILPNSHKATEDRFSFKTRKLIKLKMMKGDMTVCNALMIHAGYGFGSVVNIRFHMYLLSRKLHLQTLYDINNFFLKNYHDVDKTWF